MSEEKRQYIRKKDKVQVAYALEEGAQRYKEVFTEDISEKGLLINTLEELEVGQNVQLKLGFVYDSVPIMAKAKIAHAKKVDGGYKIGLEFVDMDDFQKQRLARYLEMIREEHSQG